MIKWTFEKIKLEAIKYNRRYKFRLGSYGAYQAALRMGILDEICAHMDSRFIWTKELLHIEALKFNNKRDFRKNNKNAYHAAHRLGVLDEICNHMTDLIIYWSFEDLKNEALKYNRRCDFEKGSSSAYHLACTRGIIDLICSHMKMSAQNSRPELELLEKIKNRFPSSKKIRDKKVKILNKPYIKGFDIDIYIPELKRGIEFDGKYHHSFKFMRKDKSKKLWSNKDIHNYHEIKDSWFASKGIQILHIKEEDWNLDKESCIQKCLKFLGNN